MAEPTDPSDIIHQIAEHLRLEQRFGGDWIPVERRKPARREPRVEEPSVPPALPGPTFRSRASEPPPEARKPKGKGLERIDPAVRTDDKEALDTRRTALEAIASEIAACRLCPLHEGRTQTVPGDGHPAPRICFIGEGPGADEDATGIPFVGRAGKLLTRMIEAIGLKREEVFIMNVVKCRPPGNRTPETSEIRACWPYLERQIEAISPEVLVTLGRPATQTLLRSDLPMGKLRGRFTDFRSIPTMPTYHPAYLLRNPNAKSAAWADLKKVHGFLVTGEGVDADLDEQAEEKRAVNPEDDKQGSLFG
jgi:DNA polymerase